MRNVIKSILKYIFLHVFDIEKYYKARLIQVWLYFENISNLSTILVDYIFLRHMQLALALIASYHIFPLD